MNDDRDVIRNSMLAAGVTAALFLGVGGKIAENAVQSAYHLINKGLIAAHYPPLTIADVFTPHRLPNGRVWPSDPHMGGTTVDIAMHAINPLVWLMLTVGGVALLLALIFAVKFFSPELDENPINKDLERIELKDNTKTLPVIRTWRGKKYGLKRSKPSEGRQELGNMYIFGKAGRGKSNIFKWWLNTETRFNFIVIDIKPELFNISAGFNAKQGKKIIQFDLMSMKGYSIDPLDTDSDLAASEVIEKFLPTSGANAPKDPFWNQAAQKVALAIWKAARATNQSAMVLIAEFADMSNEKAIETAKKVIEMCPDDVRDMVEENFKSGYGVLWNEPTKDGANASVVNNFKAAFAPLVNKEILSSLCQTTFNPAELADDDTIVYISAPNAIGSYKIAIEFLASGILESVRRYVMEKHGGKAQKEIIFIADEAGNLRIPNFSGILTLYRSVGITTVASFQTVGQLGAYTSSGNWRELNDASHHYAFYRTDDEDTQRFIDNYIGDYDKLSVNKDKDGNRQYIRASAFKQIKRRWRATKIIALLDYDYNYKIFGFAVNPFDKISREAREIRANMAITPPEMPIIEIPPIKLTKPRQEPPAPSAAPDGEDELDTKF